MRSIVFAVLVLAAFPAFPTFAAAPFTVRVVGHGQPMILIPGLLSSGEVWDGAVEHYQSRYEMHVLTLAGFAGAPPSDQQRFLQSERDAIIDYIRAHKMKAPVLVGHSLGGFLSLWIAATAPADVGAVVSVDGVPFLPALMNPGATADSMKDQGNAVLQQYSQFTPDQLEAQSRYSLATMIKDSRHVDMAAGWSRESDARTAGTAIAEMLTTDLRGSMAAIKAPVLLIGAGDFAKAPDVQHQLTAQYESQVSQLPHHRVVMDFDARHFVMLDDPVTLYRTIDAYLREVVK